MLTALTALALLVWLLALLDRPRAFPRHRPLPRTGVDVPPARRVAAVVPARNEATSLPATLPGLLAQGAALDRIVIVDDRSTDGTAEVAADLAERAPAGSPAVEILSVERLPDGWMGKVHAQARGVAHVADAADWIFFTDADIHHGRAVTARLLAKAEEGPYDLVSVMARLRTRTFWERLLMPAFVYFFQAMYPFRRTTDPDSPVAAAAGGCVLVRRALLEDAGGPAAYRAAVIDDLALARVGKRAGGRLWLGFDEEVVSLRAYPRLRDSVDMIARSAFDELGYRYAKVPLVWFGLMLLFVLPPTATLLGIGRGDVLRAGLGGGGWLLGLVSTLPAFRLHGVPWGYALLMPLAALVYAWATTLSALRHAFGRALRWR